MQIASRACFPLSVKREDHEQRKCSTSSSSWFSFSSAFSFHSVHLLPDLSQTKTHTEMYPQTQLGTAVCPLTYVKWQETVSSPMLTEQNKQELIFYAFDVKAVQNNLIYNCTWHNSSTVYIRTKAQDKVIIVTLQMQSRASILQQFFSLCSTGPS